MACVWGQKTQPRRGSSRFLRPRRLTLRIQLASQACFFTRRTSKTCGFYVVPCFPRLSSPTRGSPRPEITRKCCSKSPVKRSFKTAAGQKQTRTMARWPGFGGACPTGDPATEPLAKAHAWPSRSVLACSWTLLKCPKRIPSPGGGPPAGCCCSWGPFRLVKTEEMRSGTSKSPGLAEDCRLKTQPNRRISRVLRPIPRNLRDEMAS